MLRTILKDLQNAPTEFQVLPEGKIEIDGESPAYLDEDNAKKIIAGFEALGKDMVIDYEHQTLKDVQAPAAGWIKKLVWKGKDGLWAVVEWTKRAKEYLENREYRYFSPVFWMDKGRNVVRLDNVALTNAPRLNHLKPIVASTDLEKARQAQEERSRKYGIGIKEGGHVTKPGEWSDVPDDEFLDPVNYRYPCPDADQTRAAAVYWARQRNQAQYTAEERSIIEDRLEKFRKKYEIGEYRKEAKMLEKIKKLLKLAPETTEDQALTEIEKLAAKAETHVACKEIMEAVGAKEDAGKEEILRLIGSLKAPADVAVKLSQQVAELTQEIARIKQDDLVNLALKEGKTSPEELDKWGRELALKSPEQFRQIVLSRPAGSVIPLGEIKQGKDKSDAGIPDDAQRMINKLCGVDDETFKKFYKED